MEDKDHNELLDVLLAHKGPVLLSGYDNNLYRDRLKGWYREETYCYSTASSKKKEMLWMNFELFGQMTVYDYMEDLDNKEKGKYEEIDSK